MFIATSADGSDEITVRARSLKEAKYKISAERARAPDAALANTEPLGGHPPRKTRHQITWRNPITNATISVRVTHARDYLSTGSDHIEVERIDPPRAPLPITETGYRSQFMPSRDLMTAGGAVVFVTQWLDQDAKGKAWAKISNATAQGDLLEWAQASRDVAQRQIRSHKRPKPKTDHHAGRHRRRKTPPRAPA